MEFGLWLKGLSEKEKKDATGFFNVIRRRNESHSNNTSDLRIIPYSQEYSTYLAKAAEILHIAGDVTTSPSLKRLLHSKADAFFSNDYYESSVVRQCGQEITVTIWKECVENSERLNSAAYITPPPHTPTSPNIEKNMSEHERSNSRREQQTSYRKITFVRIDRHYDRAKRIRRNCDGKNTCR